MNSKLFLPILLALTTVWGVQWYFGKKADQSVQTGTVKISEGEFPQGGVVKVQRSEDLAKPLDTRVDFIPQKGKSEETYVVETNRIVAVFSNYGGQLKELSFKDYNGKNKRPLKTIYDRGVYDDQAGIDHCFLVALDKNTPYYYRLMTHEQESEKDVLTYRAENDEWIIEKTFTIDHKTYHLDLNIVLRSKDVDASKIVKPRLFFVAPVINELVDDVAVPFMLNESSGSLEKSDLSKVVDSAWYWTTSKIVFGLENRYFAHALINDKENFVQRAYYRQKQGGRNEKSPTLVNAVLEGPRVDGSEERHEWSLSFYLGPKVQNHLVQVDSRLQDLLSFGWLSWLCTLMLQLLGYLYKMIGNYGFAIIVLTIIVKIPFVPLSFFSRRKMEEYQKHQPHINRIRTKYKNDSKVQQLEVIRYHREHDLSPATPVIGCLPLLIQIPILLSLYKVLWNYLDLYHAPFFGWITDLSAKDPYYVLPLLMGVTMIWQQSLTAVQDEKQRVISWFMGIVMTVLFASFPAGLVLYWLMSNILTLVEDYIRRFITASS